ncbi:MAG TPA: GntR family transcriptional regulator [Caldilineaceae bacterium]|nr:GntR family transcriptional regulator [Caldilineaceae bacterium]
MSLTLLLSPNDPTTLKLERSSLKEQTTELLRSYIIGGRLPPGTKLVERTLADLLGTSRMPVRDALMDLEREGLVISRPNGRYVIELDQPAVENLFQLRLVLERLAVEQATANGTTAHCTALLANLQQMQEAIRLDDGDAYARSDLEAHQLIWQQARNPYLLKMLNSIVGPIFMFIANQTEVRSNWHETLQMHQELAAAICAGNVARAVASIEEQLRYSCQLSLRAFEQTAAAVAE